MAARLDGRKALASWCHGMAGAIGSRVQWDRLMNQDVYCHPKYYEVAFSYRNVPAEVAVLDALMDRHSDIPVANILELGCGPAPYVQAITERGYAYTGLDLEPLMLAYARRKTEGMRAEFRLGNMLDFQLAEPVDFAFLLLGSLFVQDTAGLVSHFDSVARALRPGGLYLLEQCIACGPFAERTYTWEASRDAIDVKATFDVKAISHVDQTAEETLVLEVTQQEKTEVFRQTWLRRLIYPQEFLMFIADRDDFEFVGWWKSWDLSQPLDRFDVRTRSIALVKRV